MKANPMEVGELISFYRRQADMTIDELAEKSGVPKGTLNKIIGGVTKSPTLDTMKALAKALGKRLADFEDEPDYANLISLSEKTHIQKYRLLDSHGREMVDLVLDKETERMELEANAREDAQEAGGDVVYVTQYYCRPMSAGTGQEAGDDAPESLHLKKEPPPGTSYVAPISGDSMEPTYHDGDHLFIHYQEEIYPGQIGVFFMDGQQWIKELGDGILISHNPAYAPRPMTEDIRCQGRVLGVCDESYFE